MTLTKWNAELIEGLDAAVNGEMRGDYLPLEGGRLKGELTVDANLILEGGITEGQSTIPNHKESTIEKPRAVTYVGGPVKMCSYREKHYVLSPSQGTIQNLITGRHCVRFLLESDEVPQSQVDQNYFFEDGQSMTIRLEVHDLDTIPEDRFPLLHSWPEEIWWVNTEDGLAPDIHKTGVITVTLWKAKGIVFGQLAGDYVAPREIELDPDAFDISKINCVDHNWFETPNIITDLSCRIFGPDPKNADTEFDWPLLVHEPQPGHRDEPTYGIKKRGGTTFTWTSRDGMHHFVGQTGSADNPGELRTFTNSQPSEQLPPPTSSYNPKSTATIMEVRHRFHCGSRSVMQPVQQNQIIRVRHDMALMYAEPPKLLGTAVDMRLRVEKGSGMDFNPDGTKMFQSVSNYLDPSLKDKYRNLIGFHQLAKPWDVGTTDFLIKGELNDIIHCDEKYSEVRDKHPDMRVCGLTFRPDGMGFYFSYVVYEVSKTLRYYFVQQDLEVPWELSSAKDDYKYSKMFTHEKFGHYGKAEQTQSGWGYRWPIPSEMYPDIERLRHINCITVSQNGRFIHVGFPHCSWESKQYIYSEKPRQFEMTTHWDMSTAELSWVGLGPACHSAPMTATGVPRYANANSKEGATVGGYRYALTHGIRWNNAGTRCFTSFVAESNVSPNKYGIPLSQFQTPILNNCHYFYQKAWLLNPDFEYTD